MIQSTYQVYQDSGSDWLGKIPEHWKVKRIKRIFKILNGSTPKTSVPSFWDGEILWVTPDDLGRLTDDTIYNTARMLTKEGYDSCGTTLAPAGSLILSTRAPIGHLAIAGKAVCTNQGCRSLVFRGNDYSRFYYYLLTAAHQEVKSWGQGSTFTELSGDDLKNIKIITLPFCEQYAIAKFLDREIKHVDTLIAGKEKLIKLLEERLYALINHVILKGLDPKVKMKESDVIWLGKIPHNRKVIRLRYTCELNPSKSEIQHLPKETYVSFLPMDKIGVDGTFSLDEIRPLTQVWNSYTYFCDNDVLVAKITPCFENGKGAMLQGLENGIGFGTTELHVLRAHTDIDPKFLYYLTRSHPFRQQGTAMMQGAAGQKRIPEDFIKDYRIGLPSKSEQKDIINFIDQKKSIYENYIKNIHDSIEIFREYRVALILATVTGKIDVRMEVA